ncbi:MAG TPA: SUMF1/EgtB/PvdO family nonheme iron enzyme, partial [Candidatus Eremiobacteraeota bacterium]|nr:SUMF1/EgtB/PvdO family nonheme iron enzyme [Candidatus Eremiobacteraeota bacterium]
IKYYDKILKDNPNDTEAWTYKGDNFFYQDKFKEAINCYNKALNINPEHIIAKERYEKSIKTCALNPNMILIPGGTFQMGSNNGYSNEKPVHTVRLSPFYMGKYEVTNTEYCAFLNSQGNQSEGKSMWVNIVNSNYCGLIIEPNNKLFNVKIGYENRPVVYVSWYGAVAYYKWLNKQQGLEKYEEGKEYYVTNKGYRLPTEAEWEYACRAGTTTNYYWGNKMNKNYCWYGDCSDNHHDVDLKLPNNFGLYDLSGNVWEWCNDWYGDYSSSSVSNPTGPFSGSTKIRRGGSWCSTEDLCRSTFRSSAPPGTHGFSTGFRLVKTQ